MTRLLFNLALAILWCALSGNVDPWNFAAGFGIGSLVLAMYYGAVGGEPYFRRGARLAVFVWKFTKAIVVSNCTVAWEVLTPKMHQRPRIVRYSVAGLTDAQRLALTNAITLTPGTLVVDISPDNQWVYVHCMYATDAHEAEQEIDKVAAMLREGIFA